MVRFVTTVSRIRNREHKYSPHSVLQGCQVTQLGPTGPVPKPPGFGFRAMRLRNGADL